MLKPILAGLAAVLATATSASALTVVNKSSKEISIAVSEGQKATVHKIAAGKSATFKTECATGCAVTGPWNFSWFAKTGDTIETDGTCLSCAPAKK